MWGLELRDAFLKDVNSMYEDIVSAKKILDMRSWRTLFADEDGIINEQKISKKEILLIDDIFNEIVTSQKEHYNDVRNAQEKFAKRHNLEISLEEVSSGFYGNDLFD